MDFKDSMKRIILCILVIFHIPAIANATVIEFNGDGSVTTYAARDYLAESRHQRKKPRVSKTSFVKEPKGNFGGFIQAAAQRYDVDQRIISAVIETESRYEKDAVSPKGARGLMQIMPATAALYGDIDLFDPEQNIDIGTRYLKYLIDKYEGDLSMATAAYNAGEGVIEKYGGIPPYPETINYVRKILFLLNVGD